MLPTPLIRATNQPTNQTNKQTNNCLFKQSTHSGKEGKANGVPMAGPEFVAAVRGLLGEVQAALLEQVRSKN
jgi:hypothetical protein